MTRRSSTHRSNRSEQIQRSRELSEKFQQALADLRQSNDYRKFLNLMAAMHHYSIRNLMLIAYQKPDATMVMGYHSWLKFNRHVKAGEHGITIFAPMRCKTHSHSSENRSSSSDEDEQDEDQHHEQTQTFFRPVTVFDVSQTEGDDLPELNCSSSSFSGDFPEYKETLQKIYQFNPTVPVYFVKRKDDSNGAYDTETCAIRVCKDMSQTETIKTLIHEEAHARLHSRNGEEQDAARSVAECEAEGIAYVVCKAIGIDTSSYSIPYAAGWMHDASDEDLKKAMDVIQKTSDSFITALQNAE